MTKRDFFIIAIKLFGLYLLITILFSSVPESIQVLTMYQNGFPLIPVLLIVLAVITLFLLLVFFADKVVDILKLDNKFDDPKIQFGKFESATIIKLGCFIIGGILLIDNIPSFLFQTYRAFQDELTESHQYNVEERFYWAINGLNLILGWLLMTNFNIVAKFFKSKV